MSTRTLIAFLLIFFATSVVDAEPSAKNKLVTAKADLMDADYRGDLGRLALLREEIKPLSGDPEFGYLADYWTGYASWRIAANGSNEQMTPDDLKANLERAAADFESSLRKKEDFADAYAAASSVHGWIAFLHRDDQALMNAHIETSKRFLAKAEAMDLPTRACCGSEAASFSSHRQRMVGVPSAPSRPIANSSTPAARSCRALPCPTGENLRP